MNDDISQKLLDNQNRTSDLERGIKFFERTTNEFGEVILLRNRITKQEFMMKEFKFRTEDAFHWEVLETLKR